MKALVLLPIIALFVSCGGYNEGVVQKSEKGFLKFSGRYDRITVVIDNGESITHENKELVYELKPGKHQVKVYRSGQLVIDRIVFVDNQTTTEIEIP
jgi:hypothetical protein